MQKRAVGRSSGLIVVVGAWITLAAGCPPETIEVPAGSFVMGSPLTERGRDVDEAQRAVTLTHSFEMGRTEVTQAEFSRLSGFDPSFFPQGADGPSLPVEQVTWFDALAHANAASTEAGLAPCYALSDLVCGDGDPAATAADCATRGGIGGASVTHTAASPYACEGFRLPTEAEWEYAARAGTTTALPDGDVTHPGCSPLDPAADAIGWYCGNASGRTTRAVGKKAANPWGFADLHGNVAEWTEDRYAADYGGDTVDPVGASSGSYRVARGGGAYYDGAAHLRSADRAGFRPDHRSRYLGFRLVRTLSVASPPPAPVTVPAASTPAVRGAWPDTLPVTFTRPDVGTPLSAAEITAFTADLTGFWRDIGAVDWLYRTSRGMAPGNPFGQPDYGLFADGTTVSKAGGVVTFAQTDWADNIMIPTGKLLNAVGTGYLSSGDVRMGELVQKWANGIVALIDGNLWDTEDPSPALMVRMLFPSNHSYSVDGRPAIATYDGVKGEERFDWNAQTIANPTNPVYGDIWLRTWRSKDDVPHIFRTLPVLRRLAAGGADAGVRASAALAAERLTEFARDMVDSGYYIRTKDRGGNTVIPLNPTNGLVADLASFVEYTPFVPSAECDNRLSAALIGYGDTEGQDCGTGFGSLYEWIAGFGHYYNWAIIRYFHLAAIVNAFDAGEDAVGLAHLEGLAARADQIAAGTYPNSDDPAASPDEAGYLVASASAGLPLTSREARHIVEQYTATAAYFRTFPNWDLWAPSVPDGVLAWKPSRNMPSGDLSLRHGEILAILEYCGAPYRNPSGAAFVDCDIVNDPSRWGEGI